MRCAKNILSHRRGAVAAFGFTLIEAVLALGISAVVLAAIGGVFYSALRLRNRSVAMLDEGSRLHPVLAVIKRDLSGAMPPDGFLASVFRCGSIESVLSRGVGIQFVTTTGPLDGDVGRGDLQEVTYIVRDTTRGQRGTMDLVRTVNGNLLASTLELPEEEVLLAGVEDFKVDCYDGYQWRDTWDTTLIDTNLPVAVRVQIQMAPQRDASDRLATSIAGSPIELIVPLTIASRTNATASTTQDEEQ